MTVFIPLTREILEDKKIKMKLILGGCYWAEINGEGESILFKGNLVMSQLEKIKGFGTRQTLSKDKNYLIEKRIGNLDGDKNIVWGKSKNFFIKLERNIIEQLWEDLEDEEIKLYLFLKNKFEYYKRKNIIFEFSIGNLVKSIGGSGSGNKGDKVEEWLRDLKRRGWIDLIWGERKELIYVK